ncbi:MAG: DeoR/GlpR family DNA-binding transcription regulator [Actinomycetota bacterium]|nr:DeoR/GlpR family DNA-binding transcription regulator [Actinomycetota bacterium]MDQ2698664.1 DeoR/GlpR family DNA-binding transcription regulator [Actinomycetota bacterium]
METAKPLIPEQRRRALLELLRREGVVSLRRAAAQLEVSQMTVRRDAAALADEGLASLVTGGVRLDEGVEPPAVRSERSQLHTAEKRAIAAAAASVVSEGSVVYLDAGTTCQAMVPFLTQAGLTVVTADLHTAIALTTRPTVRAIHTGGLIDPDSGSAAGLLAARTVAGIVIDVYFMSTGSWSLAHGVTTPAIDKLELKAAVHAAAQRTILVADSSKFGASAALRVAGLEELHAVVTDDRLPDAMRAELETAGVDVRVAWAR